MPRLNQATDHLGRIITRGRGPRPRSISQARRTRSTSAASIEETSGPRGRPDRAGGAGGGGKRKRSLSGLGRSISPSRPTGGRQPIAPRKQASGSRPQAAAVRAPRAPSAKRAPSVPRVSSAPPPKRPFERDGAPPRKRRRVDTKDPALDFGDSKLFRSRPPVGMTNEEAVVSNLYAILLKLGVVPVGLFQHQGWAQETGWLLSLQDVREVYAAKGGLKALLEANPEKFRVRDHQWLEPATRPFEGHRPDRPPCPAFRASGYCLAGAKCDHRHVLRDVGSRQPVAPRHKASTRLTPRAKAARRRQATAKTRR